MKEYNKYDFRIFLLIATLAFGLVGGALQVPRILTVLFLPSMMRIQHQCSFYTIKLKQNIILFCLFATFSLLWTPDFSGGFKDVIYFIIHFLSFFEIIVFARLAKNPIRAIVWGWIVFIICCSAVSIWELVTDHHLEYSKQDSGRSRNLGEGLFVMQRFTSVTFFNYNAYNTILCFAIPWMFYGLTVAKDVIQKVVCIICIILPFMFITYNASRGALVSFVIYAIIYIIFCPGKKIKYISVALLSAMIFYMINNMADMFVVIGARSASYAGFEEESRFTIWETALKAYANTYGLGTGAGGIYDAMDELSHGGINITHNMLLELLVQYNILFTSIFVVFLWKLFRKSLKLQDKNIRMVLLMAFAAFPAYSIINSGYLQLVPLYVFFACIYVFANLKLIKS